MALDNTSPERFNQGVGNAGVTDLLLPTWAAEIITAYESYNVFEGLVQSETIESGVEKRFPMTGRVGIVEAWDAGGLEVVAVTSDLHLADARPMATHIELTDRRDGESSYRRMLTEMGSSSPRRALRIAAAVSILADERQRLLRSCTRLSRLTYPRRSSG